jgi:hypothetical protein
MVPLTPYEEAQLERIEGFKAEPPNFLAAVLEKLTLPAARLLERAVPADDFKKWIRSAYETSEVMADPAEVARQAGVTDIAELADRDLACCDMLADHFMQQAGEAALFRTMTATGGGMLNITLMMSYSLKAIHMVGFCYGFGMHQPFDRDFAFAVLQVASASTLKEKQFALSKLGDVEDMIVEDLLENLTEEALIDAIAEAGSLTTIPVFGMAAGAVHDAAFAHHVAEVAKYCYQARWLRRQGKIERVEALPQFARSRLALLGESVSHGVYWGCFTLSLMVSYPPLLLCNLIPSNNALGRGLADGRDAARADVARWRGRSRAPSAASEPLKIEAVVPQAAAG